MANVVSGDPFIIDTATDAAITSDGFICYALAWTSASTGDGVSIQDESGIVRYASVGNTANYGERLVFPNDHPLYFNGLKVPTLGSGKVYIYMKYTGTS